MKFLIYKPSLKKTFFILLGIIFCLYVFYIRVLLKRAEELIQYRGNLFLIFLYIILIIIFLLKIKHHFFPNKVVKNIVIAYLTEKFLSLLKVVVEFHNKMFFELYMLIVERHKYNYETTNFLHRQLRNIYFLLRKRSEGSFILGYLYYGFVLVPYFIFALSLFLDVIVFKKFTVLLYLGWILILPMLWNAVFALFKTFCERGWNIYSKYFTIVKTYEINQDKTITAFVSATFNYNAQIVHKFPLTQEECDFMYDNIRKWSTLIDIFFGYYTNPITSPLLKSISYKRLILLTASLNLITFSYRLYNEIIFYPSW